jgi:hypothetical protein
VSDSGFESLSLHVTSTANTGKGIDSPNNVAPTGADDGEDSSSIHTPPSDNCRGDYARGEQGGVGKAAMVISCMYTER